MSKTEINDYLSKYDEDLANNVIYRVYGMPGPIFMEEDNDTPTPEPPTPGPDYSEPFYIDVRRAVTLEVTSGLQMSTDKTNWTDTTATTLSSGRTYFRVATDQESPLKPDWTEDENSDYDIGGNINSLVKVNFANDTNCYEFGSIFSGKSTLKSAGNLILPATTLEGECCYDSMFSGCSSLTAAPSLPATTLATYCYNYMFYGCESLTTAPELPATTLVEGCYYYMFADCTNLNYIKCLATDISAPECTYNWLSGVAATGTFVKNPNMSDWISGTNIPEGWTVEDYS